MTPILLSDKKKSCMNIDAIESESDVENNIKITDQDFSFIIEQKLLLNVLGSMYSIVEKKSIIPVLSNIMIVVMNNKITFSAINIDLSIVQTVEDMQILHNGSTTINTNLFTDIVSKLHGQITIVKKDNVVYLQSHKAKFSIATLPANLFPDVSDEKYQNRYIIDAKKLYYLLHNSSFAISTDKTKQYLNGLFLHFDEERKLCSVATDGHRLICTKLQDEFLDASQNENMNIIIPRKTVVEVMKIIKNNNKQIDFFFDNHGIKLIINNIVIFSKLINGNFPKYHKIIVHNPRYVFVIDRSVLQNAVSRVALVAPEKTKTIIMQLQKNLLLLSAYSNEFGSASEEIEVDFDADEQKIGINAMYLMDILSILISENIRIEFDNNLGPIRFIDLENEQNIYILMPVRVG